jgi:hypothetical protein
VLRNRYGIDLARSTAVLESIVLDDASSSQVGVRQDRRALCPPAALRTPRGDVWNTPATSTVLIARRSRFPNSSGLTDSHRSECALALP